MKKEKRRKRKRSNGITTKHSKTLLVAGAGKETVWGQEEQCNYRIFHSCVHGLSDEVRNKTQISQFLALGLMY